jgi:hypothetical protein
MLAEAVFFPVPVSMVLNKVSLPIPGAGVKQKSLIGKRNLSYQVRSSFFCLFGRFRAVLISSFVGVFYFRDNPLGSKRFSISSFGKAVFRVIPADKFS